MLIEVKNELSGRWLEWEAKSTDPSKPTFRGKMPNLILNQGLDRIGENAGGLFIYCKVGTGTTAPAVTDNSLEAEVASTSARTTNTGNSGAAPYYSYARTTWTFAVGFVASATNLGEIAAGWGSASTDIYSRALLLDAAGSPTTISVDETYEFRATYEHRIYPPSSDNVQSGVVDAGTSVSHDLTVRASRADSSTLWHAGTATRPASALLFEGLIGSITGSPSGSSSSDDLISEQPYTTGNYYLDFSIEWGSSKGNFASGINAYQIRASSVLGWYQIGVDPAIAKDDTQKTELTFRTSWARKAI